MNRTILTTYSIHVRNGSPGSSAWICTWCTYATVLRGFIQVKFCYQPYLPHLIRIN